MNIHIDKSLNESLKRGTILTCEIGSPMYDLSTKDSDKDLLSIYIHNTGSFLWEHHQFQYKEDDVDYNYSTLQGFIRNLLTGDATINFEVLYSKEIENSPLSFLAKNKEKFITYNVIKSYLGLAKRDFKKANSGKKLSHAIRGVMMAEDLLKGEFSLTGKNRWSKANWFETDNHELLKEIKDETINKNKLFMVKDEFIVLMDELRFKLNERLRLGTIDRVGDPEFLMNLDIQIMTINENYESTDLVATKKSYEVLEYGVSY